MIDELDEHCLLVHRDQCLTTSNTSNYDQTEKPLIEIFDKQVFTSYSNSDRTADLFVF